MRRKIKIFLSEALIFTLILSTSLIIIEAKKYMATKNDITGDSLVSKYSNQKYIDNYDAIFRKNKNDEQVKENETTTIDPDTTTSE